MSKARYLTGVAATIVALATCASAGGANAWTLRFSFVPDRVYQGLPAAVSVLVKPTNARCSLVVRYANGTKQSGLRPVVASAGQAQWTWSLAQFAATGPARATVACGSSGSLTSVFTVAGKNVAHSKTTKAAPGWTLRFSFVPERAYQGQPAAVSVLVKPAGTHCSLVVRYVDGTTQAGLDPVVASDGRAQWTWPMAQLAPAGPARASVACGHSGSLTRTFTVVGGTVSHSKLSIVTQGYSQRDDSYDRGSAVSYGVLVDNPSTSQDAQNVTVLVNFVDANDHVLQSATTRVPTIAAGATFNLGGNATIPSQIPVTKLEVVVQTESFVSHDFHVPAVENVQIVGSQFDPGWVGEIDGALVNDDLTRDLTSAQLSVVLFDASGNVVGGGTGFLLASLPPGTRAYFSAGTGFSSVALDHASVAAISIEPSYHAP